MWEYENASIKKLIKTTHCDLMVGVDVNDKVFVHLENCWLTGNDGFLHGSSGRGDTLSQAISDYLRLFEDKPILVVNPNTDKERRIEVLIL